MRNSTGTATSRKSTTSLKLAQINARSLNRRQDEILHMGHLHSLDLIAVQETWHDRNSTVVSEAYYWEGNPRLTNTTGGEAPAS